MLRTVVLSGALVTPACAPAATPSGSATVAPVSQTSETPASDPSALADLDRGERIIAVAGGDCAAACEALSIVTRARVRLCSPATSSCEDAERREDAATKQVASFCEPCGATGAPAADAGAAP